MNGGKLYYVDQNVIDQEAKMIEINGNDLQLNPFAVAVLYPDI